MILVLDNYDSFVHNLARLIRSAGQATEVIRSDQIGIEEIRHLRPMAIVISPGPGRPVHAGSSVPVVRELVEEIPILGVCLGHQAIVEALGGNVSRAQECFHGRTSQVVHDGLGLFDGLPSPFEACRYHSLVARRSDLPAALEVTAQTAEGEVMAVAHREFPVFGVQFHPEAILTQSGERLIENFLAVCAKTPQG